MTDFQHLSKEEREEWLRNTVTMKAMAMLRSMEIMTRDTLIASTHDNKLEVIKYNSGFMRGFSAAIDALTGGK
jgi:hypothetical protein